MIVVIIAGGSGTRLWPLSTPEYPKHLLKLTNEKSLLQNTLERAKKLTDFDKIFIIPESSHINHVKDQLDNFPEHQILVEPARRGTASCIIRALLHIKSLKLNEDEAVAFLWADHLIRDERGFISSFKRACSLVEKYKKNVFIGAEPTYPSTGFGYMHKGASFNGDQGVYELEGFVEKPDLKTAKRFFSSGDYLWNMGYLVTSVNVFERDAEKFAESLKKRYDFLSSAADIDQAYLDLESQAIEYAYSEKLKGSLAMAGGFDWIDIGSYADLHSISALDEAGNHIKGENVIVEGSTNCFVQNETGKPVAVIGLDNVVVIDSPNGLLVVNKNFAQKVGDVSKKF